MVTIKKAPGRAQFEISIDGKPCSYRDRKDVAISAAEYLKRKFPHSDVVVMYLPSGEVTVAAYKPHDDTHRCHSRCARPAAGVAAVPHCDGISARPV